MASVSSSEKYLASVESTVGAPGVEAFRVGATKLTAKPACRTLVVSPAVSRNETDAACSNGESAQAIDEICRSHDQYRSLESPVDKRHPLHRWQSCSLLDTLKWVQRALRLQRAAQPARAVLTKLSMRRCGQRRQQSPSR
eukprot:2214547-Prymnesium_polylepis.1